MNDPLPGEALVELRWLLAELRERVLSPLLAAAAEPPGVWMPPPESAETRFLHSALEHQQCGAALGLPAGTTAGFSLAVEFSPAGMREATEACVGVVGRLCWVLGLSDIERRFVLAAASADRSEAKTALAAYADWLQERGRDEGDAT